MRDRTAGWIVAATVVAAYALSLPGTFHFDDQPTILANPAITDSGNLARYFVDPNLFSGIEGNAMYRPVLLVTYLVNWKIAAFHPFVWHLTNILIHALNAFLVVLLASRLLAVFSPRKPAGYLPLLAGLVFALHPIHSEVVNYISSRSGAIATMGFLGALILHLGWTRGNHRGGSRALLLFGSLLFLAVGFGGKEIAAAFVPVVVVLELLAPGHGGFSRRCARAAMRAAPALLLTIGYLYLRKVLFGSTGVSVASRMFVASGEPDLLTGGGRTVFQNLITQARVFWIYAGLLLFPLDLAVDRYVRVSTSIAEPQVIAALLGIAVVFLLLALAARRHPLVTLGGAIFLFGLAPTSSFVPLNVVMNEHRLYLPGVGLALIVALGLGALIRKWPRPAVAGAAVLGACWLAIIGARSLVWQDPLALWQASVAVSPLSFRSHNQVGASYREMAMELGPVPEALPLIEQALAEFRIASEIYPTWPSAHLNLGIAYRDRATITGHEEDNELAVASFSRFGELSVDTWRARLEIAATYGRWQRYDEAIRLYGEMAAEERAKAVSSGDAVDPGGPRNPLYLRPMAKMSMERGDHAAAEAYYREILDSFERDTDAWLGLARAFNSSGRREEAMGALRTMHDLDPRNPEVQMTCARFFAGLEPPEKQAAAAHFQKAISLGYHPSPAELERYLK